MLTIKNLLLIAGTGTKSGKTTMACKLIELFPEPGIYAIKITPHFHETTEGLVCKSEEKGYAIYKETNSTTFKDTSRMLRAGAREVYFAKVWDDQLYDVFSEILKYIPSGAPIICESPALRNFAEPGVFIIMTSDTIEKHKDVGHLQNLPHVLFRLEELENIKDADDLPIGFSEEGWIYRV